MDITAAYAIAPTNGKGYSPAVRLGVEPALGRYSLNRVSRPLRSLALRVKKINQVLDLILLKHLSKSRHSSPTIMDLMFDLRLVQTFSNNTQVRSELSSPPIHSMAVLTPLDRKSVV